MDYLKSAREAYETAQRAKGGCLAQEYCRYAEVSAFIAIAEELRKLNESLRGVRIVIDDRLGEMGIATPL